MNSFIRKNLWLLELIAIAMASYLMAKMTTNLIAVKLSSPSKISVKPADIGLGAKEEKPTLSDEDLKVIVERNIFDSANIGAEAAVVEETPTTEPQSATPPSNEPVQTSLSVELVSTFSVGEGKDSRSNAMIVGKDTSKSGDVLRVNESFQSGTKIVQILFDRVVFTNSNRLEYVLLNDFVKGKGAGKPEKPAREKPAKAEAKQEEPKAEEADTGQTKFTINRSEIDNALANVDQLFTQIRAVPYSKEGKMSGLKLLSVKGDSIFAKLGLKRGDVLEKVNGKEFDIKQGMDLFNSLKGESKITLDLIRRGKSTALEYEIQ